MNIKNIIKSNRYARSLKAWLMYLKYIKGSFSSTFNGENSDANSGKMVVVPLLETSHYQYFQVLAVAKALELRGARVKILLCDSSLAACEIKSINNKKNPCLECVFSRNKIIPLMNLDTITISNLITNEKRFEINKFAEKITSINLSEFFYKDIEIMKMVRESVVRYYYGDVPDYNDQKLKVIIKEHAITSMINIEIANTIIKEWNPDIYFGNMQVYSMWEPYYLISKKYKKKYFTMSLSQFDYRTIVLNRSDLYKPDCQRFTDWLSSTGRDTLDKSEHTRLTKFLEKRILGSSEIFQDLNFFSSSQNIQKLKIDKTKRNIFLFSNIFWDVGVSDSTMLYKDIQSWVLDTIKIVQNRTDINLYIKPHPGEEFDNAKSRKGIESYINEEFPILPNNVKIISPNLKINTYELFEYIDLGIVHQGTLGLEMLCSKIPIAVVGSAYYSLLDAVTVIGSIENYKDIIFERKKISVSNMNEVNLFAYFYFIKCSMPWTLTSTAYAHDFKGYSFDNIERLKVGSDKYLDHLCNCILDSDNTIMENW